MSYNVDNNDVITISYKGLTFEVDVIEDIIMLDPEICNLFEIDNVETQPFNRFCKRLIDGWNKKISIGYVDNNN